MSDTTPTAQPDAELNALVLCSAFGWRWMSKGINYDDHRLTALIAPDNDVLGYVPINYRPASWKPSDAKAERFTDWDEFNVIFNKPGLPDTFTLPDFCQDANLLPLLLERVKFHFADVAYIRNLGSILGILPMEGKYAAWAFKLVDATPRQITEAWLRTLGHWPANW
jgi:hypothetical protein